MADNLEECLIDQEFRNHLLESVNSQTPLMVIATIRESQEVHELIRGLRNYSRGSPEFISSQIICK